MSHHVSEKKNPDYSDLIVGAFFDVTAITNMNFKFVLQQKRKS